MPEQCGISHTTRNPKVAGNVIESSLLSQQPRGRGSMFVKKLLMCRLNSPSEQAMNSTIVREGSNRAGWLTAQGEWFSCAWTPGEQSHNTALYYVPWPYRSIRCSHVSHECSLVRWLHTIGQISSWALATALRQPDGDSFHRASDVFSVATGSTLRDRLILQAAAPCVRA